MIHSHRFDLTAALGFNTIPALRRMLILILFSLAAVHLPAADPSALSGLDAIYPTLDALYRDLHRNPELSLQEEHTAAKMAARLRELGYEVSEHVGGHGVVGVLRNGTGPTVMLRTDMDALPVKEQTGLPYASTVTAKNSDGETVSVMHACGHDVHMAAWTGAAALLAKNRSRWRGTLVFIGQPAEEVLRGAEMMIQDGLLTRFPKPDFVLGVHDTPQLPAGQIGVISGPAGAASNSVDITFFGKGGHGAAPHRTIDPLLIAARAVVTLQTIVSREVNPIDPAVVTVGTFHAGTRANIIADEAKIQLTVRSYKPEVQKQLLAAIARIAKAEAAAAGAPVGPKVAVSPNHAEVSVKQSRAGNPAWGQAPAPRGLGEQAIGTLEGRHGLRGFRGFTAGTAGVPRHSALDRRHRAARLRPRAKAARQGVCRGLHSPAVLPRPRAHHPRRGGGRSRFPSLELLGGRPPLINQQVVL